MDHLQIHPHPTCLDLSPERVTELWLLAEASVWLLHLPWPGLHAWCRDRAECSHEERWAGTGDLPPPGRGETSALLLLSIPGYLSGEASHLVTTPPSWGVDRVGRAGVSPGNASTLLCGASVLRCVWVELRLGP